MRGHVQAIHPSGFQVTLTIEDLEKLDGTIDWLLARGYRPTTTDAWQRTPTEEPLCPKHRVVMSLRQRQGDEWYSHRVQGDGTERWCRGCPTGKADDGFVVC